MDWLALAMLFFGSEARGQEVPANDLANEAEVAFQIGVQYMKRGEYLEALSFLLQSNRLANNPSVVYNIAGAYRALGQYDQAYQYYTAYLKLESDPERRSEGERVRAQIEDRVALIEITSTPPGATIYIDRRELGSRGVTPQIIAVPAGSTTIHAELLGFEPTSTAVTAVRGASRAASFELEPVLGSVRIFGEPEGAEVRLEGGGTVLGTLPSTFEIPVGTRVLEVSAPGYTTRKAVAEVEFGEITQIDGTLTKLSGRLMVEAPNHDGALVELDGQALAFTPAIVDVPIGEHTLRVSSPGTDPVVQTIDVSRDAPVTVSVQLRGTLDATVVTAARREERISETPAVISVIDRASIESFGPLDLYERLSTVSGIETIESYFGYTQVTFRGLLQTHYNNKSLLLINGHPLYSTVKGSYYLEQVPITAIERIEVVRSPASTLYATNAYGGVINVITKAPTDKPETEIYLRGGAFWTRDVGFSMTRKVGELGLAVFGQVRDSDGYDFKIDRDEDGLRNVDLYVPLVVEGYENDASSFYAGLTYRDLSVNLGFFDMKKDKFGLIPTVVSTGPRDLRGGSIDATQLLELADDQQLSFNAYYDGMLNEERSHYPPVEAAPGQPVTLIWESHKGGGELSYRGSWFEERPLNLLAGVNGVYQAAPPYTFNFSLDENLLTGEEVVPGSVWEAASTFIEPQSQFDVGTHLNADWNPIKPIKLSGGLLYNINSNYGGLLAPRGGLVLTATNELVFKFLYGRAYRSPSLFELEVDTTNVLFGGNIASEGLGVPPLQPELIDTIEAAVDWRPSIYSARLTAYASRTENLIERSGVAAAGSPLGNDADTPYYANNPGQRFAGLELEFEARLQRWLRVMANGSLRRGWSFDGEPLPYWFAPYLANASADLAPWEKWRISGNTQLVGPRGGTMLAGTPDARELDLDPYLLANVQLAHRPTDTLELAIAIKNLFDMRYAYPEYIRQNINTVPGGPGRQWYAQVRASF